MMLFPLDISVTQVATQAVLPQPLGNLQWTGVADTRPILGPSLAAPLVPIAVAGPGGVGDAPAHYFTDFYFRIWTVPAQLSLRNPRLNAPFEIAVWNAYPFSSNQLESISQPVSGVVWSAEPGDVWRPSEYRQISFTLLTSSPLAFDEAYTLDFVNGAGQFSLRVNRASTVLMIPDGEVKEKWVWLTDVMVSHNGTEQRVGLRTLPRRELDYSVKVMDESEFRTQWRRLFSDINSRVVIPYWQYNSRLADAAAQGTTRLNFDPRTTDLRVGEYALLRGQSAAQLVVISSLDATGGTVEEGLEFNFERNTLICPAVASRFEDKSKLQLTRFDNGLFNVRTKALEPRGSMVRPGSTAVVAQYDGHDVIETPHLNAEAVDYSFHGNYEVLDADTGIQDIFAGWKHPQVEGARRWLVQRMGKPDDMDWWRTFLSRRNGSRAPFLMQTWRPDFTPKVQAVPVASSQLTVVGSDWLDLYAGHETFRRLALHTNAGIVYRTIAGAARELDDSTTFTFTATLPEAVTAVYRVSFLLLMRLATDEVSLDHRALHTTIEFGVRTTDG